MPAELENARKHGFGWCLGAVVGPHGLAPITLAAALLFVSAGCDEAADDPTQNNANNATADAAQGAGPPDASGSDAGASTGNDAGSDAAVSDAGGTSVAPDSGGVVGAAADASTGGGSDCTREGLKSTIDAYFAAMAAHDPAPLQVAANVKFTENGRILKLGEGLWTSAGAPAFTRKLLDPERCGCLAQAVIDEGGKEVLFAVRLKLQNQAISEVETYLVRSGLFFQPAGVKDDGGANWEGILPPEQRSTREQLNAIADAYFESFSDSTVMVPYDTPCKRFEGGLMPVDHCSKGIPADTAITARRYPIADVEAGIAVGFVLFGGTLLDFHMFKVKSGKITGIQALVGPRASESVWE